MYQNLTRLQHLRNAMIQTMAQITNVASAAAGAIEEVAANAVTLDQVQDAIAAAVGGAVPPDPMDVYRSQRPNDWLAIPEPAENEIYLLFHIPDGSSSLLSFTVTCSDSYTVQLLSAAGNLFAPVRSSSIASGTAFETQLSANDFGSLTSDGMKQVLIKITGNNILSWTPSAHTKKTVPSGFVSWNIVEFHAKLPSATSCKMSGLWQLKFFALYGQNCISDLTAAFSDCRSLSAVLRLDTNSVQNMNMTFYNCSSLIAIPLLQSQNVTNMNSMFYGCAALATIPPLDTARVTNMNSMFCNCTALFIVPPLDTARVSDMSRMFYNCKVLSAIRGLNISVLSSVSSMFGNCSSLASLRFTPASGTPTGGNLVLTNCSLGHSAILALLADLPAVSTARTLTLTGNPGAAELTDTETAVAAEKNWTLKL